MMALVMLLAILLSIQVRVASLPIREARASWVVKLLYQWQLFERRRALVREREQRVFRMFHLKNSRWRRVKFNETGGLSIGPVWYAKPQNQRLIVDAVLVVVMLLLSTWLLSTPIACPLAVINSAGSGAWNVGGTWVGGVAPGTLDDAVILATHNVNLAVAQTTGSVNIQASGTLNLVTFTLTIDDENAAGYAYDNDGTLIAGSGTLLFTYPGLTLADWVGTAGNPWNVMLQGTSALVLICDTALTIDSELTITSGTLDTSANNYALTVVGATMIFGTLTPNASVCSWGSGLAAYAMDIEPGGILSPGSGAWTAGSFCIWGTCTFTSSTLTINSRGGGGDSIYWGIAANFNDNNGTVSFTSFAGTQTMGSQTNIARTLYNLTLNNNARTLQFGNGVGFTLTVDSTLTVTAGTLDTEDETGGTDRNLVVTGAAIIAGTIDGNASTISFGWIVLTGTYSATSGVTTITSESPTGYAFDNDGTLTPNNGTITIVTPTTTLVDFAGTGGSGPYNLILNHASLVFTLDTALTVGNNLTITSGTLDTSANNYTLIVTARTDVTGTLTCNGATCSFGSGTSDAGAYQLAIKGGGIFNGGSGSHTAGSMGVYGTGNATMTSGTMTFNGVVVPTEYMAINDAATTFAHANGNVIAAVGGAGQTISIGKGSLYNLTINHTGRISYLSGALTVSSNLTITVGTFNTMYGGNSFTLTVTSFCNITGTLTGNASVVSVGNMAINSGGIYSATSATTTITSTGAGAENGRCFTQYSGGTFTHNNGTFTVTATTTTGYIVGNGTTVAFYNFIDNQTGGTDACIFTWLGSVTNVTIANNCTVTDGMLAMVGNTITTTISGNLSIASGASFICQAAGNTLTVTNQTTVTGTLTCNASTCSFGSGVTTPSTNYTLFIYVGGTFNGGSGTHTVGSFVAANGCTCTLTSGTMTVNAATTANQNIAFALTVTQTFSHNNGTVIFTYAGTQLLFANAAQTFYNLQINKASGTVQYYNGNGFAITVANNFTITAGTFSTAETVSGTSRNLTVTGAATVAGTLTGNASAISLGWLVLTGTYTATSGTTTITSESAGGYAWDDDGTFVHNSGTVTFTYAGTTLIDATGAFSTVVANHASLVLTLDTAMSCASLTITAGQVTTSVSNYSLTVSVGCTVAGTLTGNASAISCLWMAIGATGVYTATSATTTFTGKDGSNYVITMTNGGTFTHSNGTCTFSNASGVADIYAASGALSLYNVSISGTSVRNYTTTLTIANNLTVDASKTFLENVAAKALVVGSTATINGTMTCGSASVDLNGSFTMAAAGVFTAPTGTFTIAGMITGNCVGFAHSSSTVTVDGTGGDGVAGVTGSNLVLYNLTVTKTGDFQVNTSMTIAGALSITAGSMSLDAVSNAVSLTMGTASATGSIYSFTANAFMVKRATTYAVTLKAASSAYPCICTGSNWDWDNGGAASSFIVTDMDIGFNATIGPTTVTVTATRVRFSGTLTVTTATLVGSDCVIDASTTTVSSGLYIEGWYDPTETTRGGHDWVLIGGAYTLAANKTYSDTHFYKIAGTAFTQTATLTLTDCDLDGTGIKLASTLVDTNSGTVVVQFTIDLHIQDIAGTGIDGATVTICDKDDNVLATTTTSSGDIAAQTILYATYSTSTITEYPHELRISKTNYNSIGYDLTINRPMDMTLVMTSAASTSPTGWYAWFNQNVTIYPYASRDDYAVIAYGTPATVASRIVYARKEVRTPGGAIVISRCQIYVDGSVAVSIDDKIVLPDLTEAFVVAVDSTADAGGAIKLKVIYT